MKRGVQQKSYFVHATRSNATQSSTIDLNEFHLKKNKAETIFHICTPKNLFFAAIELNYRKFELQLL